MRMTVGACHVHCKCIPFGNCICNGLCSFVIILTTRQTLTVVKKKMLSNCASRVSDAFRRKPSPSSGTLNCNIYVYKQVVLGWVVVSNTAHRLHTNDAYITSFPKRHSLLCPLDARFSHRFPCVRT